MMKREYLPYKHCFLRDIREVRNLLCVVAMESEESSLIDGIEHEELALGTRLSLKAKAFRLPGCRVIVARSGVGLVNAGLLLSAVVEQHPVDAVILLGVGGALDRKLEIGDTVVSRQIIQHDSVSSHEDGTHFIAPGELTLSVPADQQVDPVMRCDEVLVRWIMRSIDQSHVGRIHEGTILSGSEFAANPERKKRLRGLCDDALLVDMEAAALAQMARRYQLPFVAAKTVVDRADPSRSVSEDYNVFLNAATAHSRAVLQGLLKTFGG